MTFLKFKLEKNNARPAPVPIAAAVPQNNGRQHASPRARSQVPRTTSSASHAREASEHDITASSSRRQWRRSRRGSACAECKTSKSRCEKSMTANDKCRRCLLQNRECTGHHSARPSPVEPSQKVLNSTSDEATGINFNSEADPTMAFSVGFNEVNSASGPKSYTRSTHLDDKIDSVLTPEIAEQVFLQFVTNFAPKCPIVVFPPGTTPAHVRNAKPLLFLSILSVACAGYCTLDQQKELALEVRSRLAESAIVRGEKSIELIQALQIVAFWYRSPDSYTQMIQNQLASIATTMAMDLGLDNLKPASTAQDKWIHAEAQRAWISCFLLSTSLSLILRRPNPTPSFMKLDDYISDLQRTNVSPTDSFLCKLVTTELLCHNIDQELCLSNPAQVVSAPSTKSIAIIQPIQTRIDSLALGQFQQFEKSLFEFGRLASSLYMNELALHVKNNIDEFKAPFFAKSLKTCSFLDNQDSSHLSKICAIIMASRGLLDIFLGLSIPDMLTLPPHIYGGRVIYAVILLMKIHKAITISGKSIGEITQAGDLGLEAYLERLIVTSKCLRAQDERSPLSRAFMIMPQLVEQFKKPNKADEDPTIDRNPSNTGNDQSNTAPPASGPVPSERFSTFQAPENNSIPGNPRSLDDSTSQMDGLVQSTIPPYPPPTPSEDTNFGAGPSIAPDTWFWEFFNTDMLN